MASAKGCSDPFSSEAARVSSSFWLIPSTAIISVSFGLPSVRVPVLSTIKVSTFANLSNASASRTRTPDCAPRPVAIIIDIGVANPKAQGHAIIRTETATTKAWIKAGCGPNKAQIKKAIKATRTTNGTKYPATVSVSPWIGALDLWADETMSTILANIVSPPTRSASIMSEPVPFKVPPVNLSFSDFSTAIGSPDIILSSIEDLPSRTIPSTGTLSPGRTRNRSPTRIFSMGTSRSEPSELILLAILGDKLRRARIAEPVC